MTPGSYIRQRREAAGLSMGDVLAVLGGGGVLSAALEDIEADREPATGMDAALLAWAFAIDDMVIARLKAGEPVQVCRECGCSFGFECDHPQFGTCTLGPMALCSGCAVEAQVHLRVVA